MKMFTLLQMADPASVDSTAAVQQSQGGGMSMWIMLLLMFGVMWFFMIRPQRKQQKELQNFRNSLQKGDKVVTIGGIYGTVVEIKDATVLIEIDNSVKIRVSKQALVKDFSDPQQ
jgi:preprotein translocase subunit YajC